MRNRTNHSAWLWRWMTAAALGVGSLAAQDEPGRGVARISLIQGDVSVRRGDSGEWVAAAPNAPLVVQDRILTGPASRAEIQLDWANMARLWSGAEVRLSELEYRRYGLQLAAGSMAFRVLRDSDAEVEISTQSVAVRPVKRGLYRLAVLEDGTTEVTVRSGEVEIFTPRGSERLKSGKTMLVRGSSSDPEFQIVSAIPRDEFDAWNERRDSDLERSTSYRYVSPSISGAEDLDYHGRWVYDQPYGWVWTPTVSVGWAPYRHGRWSWVDWYGWSWVSYDPWGWAPYHYGRWYMGSHGWCWWPGAIRSRHYWSPGLVAWVGFGGAGVGVGFGGWGRVGWIPLAPHEPFYPWYGSRYYGGYRNRTYVDNSVNIVNNINVTNVYRNARVSNGVTAVDSGDFRTGRYSGARLADGDLHNAAVVRGQLPLAPDRTSIRFADRDVTNPGRGTDEGRFYTRRSPSPVDRVSFEDQRRGMEEVSRRTFGGGRERVADRVATPQGGTSPVESVRGGDRGAAAIDAGSRRSGTESEGRGWRRVGDGNATTSNDGSPREGVVRSGAEGRSRQDSGGRSAGGSAERNRNSDRGNWRRFGEPSGGGSSRQPDATDGRGWRQDDRVIDLGNRGGDRGSWRRFGEPGTDRNPAGAGSDRRDSPVFNSPRMESPRMESPRMERPRTESPRIESPRMEAPRAEPPPASDGGGSSRRRGDNSSMQWRRFDSSGSDSRGGEAVRVNPEIVRERGRISDGNVERRGNFDRPSRMEGGNPGFESRSPRWEGGGGGGGGPRMERSAPRMEGGWGGSRGGGGGTIGPRMEGGGMRGGGGGGNTRSGGGEGRGGRQR